MVLENKLGLNDSLELAKQEEKLSKERAKRLFEENLLADKSAGTFETLAFIHQFLFEEIYDFTGQVRQVNIAKGSFRFAPVMYLQHSLETIGKMPQDSVDAIIDKYVEMNVAHPFREGNGRAMRLWLESMLRSALGQVVDWNAIDKDEYFNAMVRSHVSTGELKYLLLKHLTDDLSQQTFFKGLDTSYYYEGFTLYKTEDL